MNAQVPAIPCVEFIDGQQFAWVDRTPFLQAMIAHASSMLAAALAHRGVAYRIDRSETLALGERTTLIPDLLVTLDGRPQIVVEYRSESTERYVLGPKRLVYGRARIPEFWFVDPHAGAVLTMLREAKDTDYGWPPRRYGSDDTVISATVPGLEIPVAGLLWSVY